MREFFQNFILNQIVIIIALSIIFAFLTRWALFLKKDRHGYWLGWLVSLLLVLIYTILFGDRQRLPSLVDLTAFQILLSIALGLIFGGTMQYTHRIADNKSKRSLALRVALYTIFNLVLLGLVIIESSVVQRMIGIFGLAFGIATLLGIVWSSIDDDPKQEEATQQAQTQSQQAQGLPPKPQPPNPNRPPRFGSTPNRKNERK
jgi:hypothetical protein